jgi:hypothetical protein
MMHEAGETARSIIDVFKSQPVVLGLILINLALVGLLYWGTVTAERERTRGLELLYENRKTVGDLLHNCYPVAPPDKGK